MGLKLGVIGTNWITEMFVRAAIQTKQYKLSAVFSRKIESANNFLSKFEISNGAFTDLSSFYQSGIDVVYIASPNSLHFEQTKQAIENDIHVILEKPSFSNTKEFLEIEKLLDEHKNVYFFEAARHIHQENFKLLENQIKELTTISGATLVYEKYSSRFDAYLNGENPNVFNPEFSGGALMDLGVYPIYAALQLFGFPTNAYYFPTKLENGADVRGTAIFEYGEFNVTIQFGKGANSYLNSEVLGRKDTILIDSIAELTNIRYIDSNGSESTISKENNENPMVAEAQEFSQIIQNPSDKNKEKYQRLFNLSKNVNKILNQLRIDNDIKFPSDIN